MAVVITAVASRRVAARSSESTRMLAMTIRTRVTAALLVLVTMSVAEATIVLIQHDAINRAMAEQARTASIRLHVQQMWRTVAAMQSAPVSYTHLTLPTILRV